MAARQPLPAAPAAAVHRLRAAAYRLLAQAEETAAELAERPADQPPWLSVREAASLLGVSRSQTNELALQQALVSRTEGRRRLIARASVEQRIRQLTVAPTLTRYGEEPSP